MIPANPEAPLKPQMLGVEMPGLPSLPGLPVNLPDMPELPLQLPHAPEHNSVEGRGAGFVEGRLGLSRL